MQLPVSVAKLRAYSTKALAALATVGLVVSSVLALTSLRHNNVKMIELRAVVFAADEKGDSAEITAAIQNLRSFVLQHMNTELRGGPNSIQRQPIQLAKSYERALKAEEERVTALANGSGVYAEAQAECERPELPLTERAQCMQDYVSARTNDPALQLQKPLESSYVFDFVSPSWSPDLAGWSIVVGTACLVLLFALLLRYLVTLFVYRSRH